jgi:hypothetical protein
MASLIDVRNTAYARVWTGQTDPVDIGLLCDALADRGFIPGVTDPKREGSVYSEAGLANCAFALGHEGWRFVSLSSSHGAGCVVTIHTVEEEPMPDDKYIKRRLSKPRLTYRLEAGGPSNSDRNICENLAEALMLLGEGVAEVGGRGVKGNKPTLYTHRWLGKVKI